MQARGGNWQRLGSPIASDVIAANLAMAGAMGRGLLEHLPVVWQRRRCISTRPVLPRGF